MQERKKRALAGFFFIFAFFSILLAYLLFASPGLKFEYIEGKLYLKNESSHVIEDIQIMSDDGSIIDCIPILRPNELERIILPEEKRNSVIIASAPFHREAKIRISQNIAEAALQLKARHEKAIVGKKFKVFLEICNRTKEKLLLQVREEHEKSFLKEEPKTIVVSVKEDSCKELSYEFTALREGSTSIVFSVSSGFLEVSIREDLKIGGR